MRQKFKTLCFQTILFVLTGCGNSPQGIGNFEDAKKLQKMVHEKQLAQILISDIFNWSNDSTKLSLNENFLFSLALTKLGIEKGDKEVRDLTLKVIGSFEPKHITQTNCIAYGLKLREHNQYSSAKCQDESNKCLEEIENLSWKDIKLTTQQTLTALANCNSLTMGKLADCFVFLNEAILSAQNILTCDLASLSEAQAAMVYSLDRSIKDLEQTTIQCMESLKKCEIESKPKKSFDFSIKIAPFYKIEQKF